MAKKQRKLYENNIGSPDTEDRVVITQYGQPAAVVIGVEGMDWEDVVLETNAAFWKFIYHRRNQPTISLEKLKARLFHK